MLPEGSSFKSPRCGFGQNPGACHSLRACEAAAEVPPGVAVWPAQGLKLVPLTPLTRAGIGVKPRQWRLGLLSSHLQTVPSPAPMRWQPSPGLVLQAIVTWLGLPACAQVGDELHHVSAGPCCDAACLGDVAGAVVSHGQVSILRRRRPGSAGVCPEVAALPLLEASDGDGSASGTPRSGDIEIGGGGGVGGGVPSTAGAPVVKHGTIEPESGGHVSIAVPTFSAPAG